MYLSFHASQVETDHMYIIRPVKGAYSNSSAFTDAIKQDFGLVQTVVQTN